MFADAEETRLQTGSAWSTRIKKSVAVVAVIVVVSLVVVASSSPMKRTKLGTQEMIEGKRQGPTSTAPSVDELLPERGMPMVVPMMAGVMPDMQVVSDGYYSLTGVASYSDYKSGKVAQTQATQKVLNISTNYFYQTTKLDWAYTVTAVCPTGNGILATKLHVVRWSWDFNAKKYIMDKYATRSQAQMTTGPLDYLATSASGNFWTVSQRAYTMSVWASLKCTKNGKNVGYFMGYDMNSPNDWYQVGVGVAAYQWRVFN